MTFEGQDTDDTPPDRDTISPEQDLEIMGELRADRPTVDAIRDELISGLREQGVDTSMLSDESVLEAASNPATDERLALGGAVQTAAYAIHSVRSKVNPEGLAANEEAGEAMFEDWAYARLAVELEDFLDRPTKDALNTMLDSNIRQHVPEIKPDKALDIVIATYGRLTPSA